MPKGKVVIKRPHKWEHGEVKDGNPTLRCSREGCRRIWYPYETERQKGECRAKPDEWI